MTYIGFVSTNKNIVYNKSKQGSAFSVFCRRMNIISLCVNYSFNAVVKYTTVNVDFLFLHIFYVKISSLTLINDIAERKKPSRLTSAATQ